MTNTYVSTTLLDFSFVILAPCVFHSLQARLHTKGGLELARQDRGSAR
jgi:hypothetical protein